MYIYTPNVYINLICLPLVEVGREGITRSDSPQSDNLVSLLMKCRVGRY